MTMPVALLAWSAFFGLIQAISTGAGVLAQHGAGYVSSPRDEQKPLTGAAGRNARAFANFLQTFPIFVALVLAAHSVGRDHGLASWGAQFYFWGRLAYVPLYITGSKYRTHSWWVSVFGLLLIVLKIA